MSDDDNLLNEILGEATISKASRKYKPVFLKGMVKSLTKSSEKPLKLCDHVIVSNMTLIPNLEPGIHEDFIIQLICCNMCDKQFQLYLQR